MQLTKVSLQYWWCLLWRVCLLGLYVKYQHKANTISLTVMIFFILLDRVSGPSLLAAPSSCCSAFCKVSGCALGDLSCTGGKHVKQPEGAWFSCYLSPRSRTCHPEQLFLNTQGHSTLAVFWAEREALLMGNGKR